MGKLVEVEEEYEAYRKMSQRGRLLIHNDDGTTERVEFKIWDNDDAIKNLEVGKKYRLQNIKTDRFNGKISYDLTHAKVVEA